MVTEEPSVIAARYKPKLINLAGGATTLQEREMIGEIAIVKSPLTLEEVKTKNRTTKRIALFSIANNVILLS